MTKILKAMASDAAEAQMPPRERVLAAARELFYAHGIRAVSVDDVAAAAGTNKMTLYRHFESKDRLVAEYVRSLAAEAEATWDILALQHPGDPQGQLQAWIASMGEKLGSPGSRGCAVANAAVELPEKEHPARAIIEAHKTAQRESVARLCRAAGFENPDQLADELFLLLEGARINVQSVGNLGPGSRFCEMATALIAAQTNRRLSDAPASQS